jgi:hypothetical protein
MGAVLSFPKPRNNGLRCVSNAHEGVVLAFAKHSLAHRAEVHSRQASNLLALSNDAIDFWIAVARTWENHVKSFDVSRRLHVHQHERGASSCHTETTRETCAGATASILREDEPA